MTHYSLFTILKEGAFSKCTAMLYMTIDMLYNYRQADKKRVYGKLQNPKVVFRNLLYCA